MANTSDRKVIAYIADISDIKAKLREMESLNQRLGGKIGTDLSKGLTQVGNSLGKISTTETREGLDNLSNTSEKTTQTFKALDGSLVQMTKTTKVNAKGIATTTTSFKNLDRNTVSLAQNIKRLASRALITIPIWLALRTAVMGTFSTIKNGLATISAQDKAFQKARRNLEATAVSAGDLKNQFKQLKEETLRLSLKSGKSVEELTHAYQKFATVGFNAETSLAGMIASTKLAVIEFGDAKDTANAFARSMRVLMDTSAGAKSEAQQITEALAFTDQLWQTNAFEINEFTQNLLKYASTAKLANMSTQETLTLLATLSTGGLANRAGRLLKTTILQSLQNLDEVARRLNLDIDPAVDSTFGIVLKLVDALGELNKTRNVPKELADVVGELFSLRATEIVASLTALKGTLKENASLNPDLEKFNNTFNNMTKEVGVLSDRFGNLNKEIGKAFVTGLVGGENYEKSLANIVEAQTELIDDAQILGTTFNSLGTSLKTVASTFRFIFGFVSVATAEMIGQTFALTQEVDKSKRALSEFQSVAEQFRTNLQVALAGGLDDAGLKRVIDGIKTRVKNINIEPELDRKVLQKALDILEERAWNEGLIKQEKERQLKLQQEQDRLSNKTKLSREEFLRIEKQYREELEALGLSEFEIEKRIMQYRIERNSHTAKELELQQDIINHLKRAEEIELRRTRAEGLVKNQMETLRLMGATNLQLLEAERMLENAYGINQDRNSQLQYELSLQREITREKLNQNGLSSDSVKLYKIAQSEGGRSARRVAEFLSGEMSLRTAERSDVRKIIEEFFPQELLQKQAHRFFFEGRGTNIPIGERTAISDFRALPVESIRLPKIETNINTVKLELKQALSKEQLSKQILENLSSAIENDPTIIESIEEIIENY